MGSGRGATVSGAQRTVVTDIRICARDIAQVTFARPPGYAFLPGQWFRLTLSTAGGEQTKTFSHASAPATADLEMATRLSASAFKAALAELRTGDGVTLAGPGGRFRLPAGATRIAFLTGGVGVTPVRSFLLDAAARDAAFEDAVVLFGNREPACAPYLDELSALSGIGVRVVPVFERPAAGWDGERGLISAQTVLRHVDVDGADLFVVTGPPAMVVAMDGVLDELGVASERRMTERFTA